jgi:hypothetical protein
MTSPNRHRDAAHAAEEPGVLPEYGNDTGFAAELFGEELPPVAEESVDVPGTEAATTEDPATEDH